MIMISINDFREQYLNLPESDIKELAKITKTRIKNIDGDFYIIDINGMEQIKSCYDNLLDLNEMSRETGISIEDLRFMCECSKEYDLEPDASVRCITLSVGYYIPKAYLNHFQERYDKFINTIDEVIRQDELEEQAEEERRQKFLQEQEASETGSVIADEDEENTDEIEEDEVIEEDNEKETLAEKRKARAKLRKQRQDELNRAETQRLRDKAYSNTSEKTPEILPEKASDVFPNISPVISPVSDKQAERAKKDEKLREERLKEEEKLREDQKKQEERNKHKEKINELFNKEPVSSPDVSSDNNNRIQEIERKREELRKEQEKAQEKVNEEIKIKPNSEKNSESSHSPSHSEVKTGTPAPASHTTASTSNTNTNKNTEEFADPYESIREARKKEVEKKLKGTSADIVFTPFAEAMQKSKNLREIYDQENKQMIGFIGDKQYTFPAKFKDEFLEVKKNYESSLKKGAAPSDITINTDRFIPSDYKIGDNYDKKKIRSYTELFGSEEFPFSGKAFTDEVKNHYENPRDPDNPTVKNPDGNTGVYTVDYKRIADTFINKIGSNIGHSVSHTEAFAGLSKMTRTASGVMAVASMMPTTTGTSNAQKLIYNATIKSVGNTASMGKTNFHSTQKRLQTDMMKMNQVFRNHNNSLKNVAEQIAEVDTSLGLKYKTKTRGYGKEFQAFMDKRNMVIDKVPAKNLEKLALKHPEFARELRSNAKLNKLISEKNIDFNNMTGTQIAMFLTEIKDKQVRSAISSRTGVVGFEKQATLIKTRNKLGGIRRVTTAEIIAAKSSATKFLKRYGIDTKNKTLKNLSDLLRGEHRDEVRVVLQGYIDLLNLETEMTRPFLNGFGSNLAKVISLSQGTLSQDLTYRSMFETIRQMQRISRVSATTLTSLRILNRRASKLGIKAGKQIERFNTAVGLDGLNVTARKTKELIKDTKKTLRTPFSKVKEKKRIYQTKAKNNLKKAKEKAYQSFMQTRLGAFTGKIRNRLALAQSRILGNRYFKGVGKIFGGAGKIVGAPFKFAANMFKNILKAFKVVKKYLIIAAVIIVLTVLDINLKLWLTATVGGTLTSFWEGASDIMQTEAGQTLTALYGWDKKYFNKVNEIAEDSSLASINPNLYGFIDPSTQERYHITEKGSPYGVGGFEQHYYDADGNEIARYSNAKDLLSVSYAAFDGKVSIGEKINQDYKTYTSDLWNNTHICYECKTSVNKEYDNPLAWDGKSFSMKIDCHTTPVYPCDGNCSGNGENHYTYYCNTNGDALYQKDNMKNTYWVYKVALWNNNNTLKGESNKTQNKYLSVNYGDSNKQYPSSLAPSGKGCTTVYCSVKDNSEFMPVFWSPTGKYNDENGNPIGCKLPSTDDNITCDKYTLSYHSVDDPNCSNGFTSTCLRERLLHCNNKIKCDNYTEKDLKLGKVKFYYEDTGELYKELNTTITVKEAHCENAGTIKAKSNVYITLSNGKRVKAEITYTYTGCVGHCQGHKICGGHTSCPGHLTCKGHTMTYCTGHIDLYTKMQITNINNDDIFDKADQGRYSKGHKFEGNKERKDFAKNIYNGDWEDLYGISFKSDSIPAPLDKKDIEKISLTGSNANAQKVLSTALSLYGRVPYNDNNYFYNKRENLDQLLQTTSPDSKGRILTGLNDKTFVPYVLFSSGLTPTMEKSLNNAMNTAGLKKIEDPKLLKPGDIVFDTKTNIAAVVLENPAPGYASFKVLYSNDDKSTVCCGDETYYSFNSYWTFG